MAETDTMTSGFPVLGDLTYREWHSFVEGFYSGFVWGHRQSEYEKEKHYWRTGYVIGTMIRYGFLVAAYRDFKDVLSESG